MTETLSVRDQVKAMIEEGVYTKAQIAEKVNTTPASVSSQMTYLRWMGNNIIYDLDADMSERVLKMATDDEFAAWEADKVSRSKGKSAASKKTPAEQVEALNKTIATQEKQVETWRAKAKEYKAELLEKPDDDELEDNALEADANVILYSIKLKRNRVKLEVAEAEVLEAAAAAEVDGETEDGIKDDTDTDKEIKDEVAEESDDLL